MSIAEAGGATFAKEEFYRYYDAEIAPELAQIEGRRKLMATAIVALWCLGGLGVLVFLAAGTVGPRYRPRQEYARLRRWRAPVRRHRRCDPAREGRARTVQAHPRRPHLRLSRARLHAEGLRLPARGVPRGGDPAALPQAPATRPHRRPASGGRRRGLRGAADRSAREAQRRERREGEPRGVRRAAARLHLSRAVHRRHGRPLRHDLARQQADGPGAGRRARDARGSAVRAAVRGLFETTRSRRATSSSRASWNGWSSWPSG